MSNIEDDVRAASVARSNLDAQSRIEPGDARKDDEMNGLHFINDSVTDQKAVSIIGWAGALAAGAAIWIASFWLFR
jgi:hypothetical protein